VQIIPITLEEYTIFRSRAFLRLPVNMSLLYISVYVYICLYHGNVTTYLSLYIAHLEAFVYICVCVCLSIWR